MLTVKRDRIAALSQRIRLLSFDHYLHQIIRMSFLSVKNLDLARKYRKIKANSDVSTVCLYREIPLLATLNDRLATVALTGWMKKTRERTKKNVSSPRTCLKSTTLGPALLGSPHGVLNSPAFRGTFDVADSLARFERLFGDETAQFGKLSRQVPGSSYSSRRKERRSSSGGKQ